MHIDGNSLVTGFQQARRSLAYNKSRIEGTELERIDEFRQQLKSSSSVDEKELYTGDEEQKLVALRQRDQAVRQHEQTHRSMGGEYVRGGINYEYEIGPDGKKYAVSGEVSIDASSVSGNPNETVRKMQTVKRAALAPNDPSPQDVRAAMEATRRAVAAERNALENSNKPEQPINKNKLTSHNIREYESQQSTEFKVDGSLVSNLFEMYM